VSQITEHRPAPEHPDERGTRVFPLLAVIALLAAAAVVTGNLPIFVFVVGIVGMVMIHEAGHFVTAKWSGMKVTEFFFGFGPRLFSTRKGETEYGVKALPLGGYVKIVGMSNVESDIDPADEPRTYRQQSYPKRMLVAVAGVLTHFVMAFFLLFLIWAVIGVPELKPEVGSISKLETGPSPAEQAGFALGDRILSVDGRPVKDWETLPPYIRQNSGRPLTFVVERDGRQVTLTAIPVDRDPTEASSGFIGIGATPFNERQDVISAAGRSVKDVWNISVASVQALGSFFTPGSISDYAGQLGGDETKADEEKRFLSVVGVGRLAGQAAESGYFNLIYLLVVLNLFVGIFNLVPLLPLDGGHMAIATYERLRSRGGRRYHADVGKMMPVAFAVVMVLVLIGVSALYLDIVDPIDNPFR
jgi:membrane-associated protease RseP (regulator of RpoE activity)